MVDNQNIACLVLRLFSDNFICGVDGIGSWSYFCFVFVYVIFADSSESFLAKLISLSVCVFQ